MKIRKGIKEISCEEALERILEYIDGELAGKNNDELEQHIETCKGCLKKVEFQLELKKRLKKIKPVLVSKKLADRLNIILN